MLSRKLFKSLLAAPNTCLLQTLLGSGLTRQHGGCSAPPQPGLAGPFPARRAESCPCSAPLSIPTLLPTTETHPRKARLPGLSFSRNEEVKSLAPAHVRPAPRPCCSSGALPYCHSRILALIKGTIYTANLRRLKVCAPIKTVISSLKQMLSSELDGSSDLGVTEQAAGSAHAWAPGTSSRRVKELLSSMPKQLSSLSASVQRM